MNVRALTLISAYATMLITTDSSVPQHNPAAVRSLRYQYQTLGASNIALVSTACSMGTFWKMTAEGTRVNGIGWCATSSFPNWYAYVCAPYAPCVLPHTVAPYICIPLILCERAMAALEFHSCIDG